MVRRIPQMWAWETRNKYGQRPQGAIGAQTDFRKNSSVPADGTVGVGATQWGVGFRGSAVGADEKQDRTYKREGAPAGKGRQDAPTRQGGAEMRQKVKQFINMESKTLSPTTRLTCGSCKLGTMDMKEENLSLEGKPTLVICSLCPWPKHLVSELACEHFQLR